MTFSFWEMYAAKVRFVARKNLLMKLMEQRYRGEFLAVYKAAFPKRKEPTLDKVFKLLPEEANRIKERWEGRAKRVLDYVHGREDRYRRVLNRLARKEGFTHTEHPVTFHVVWRSTYSTQGYGADKYAREDAQRRVDKAVHYGLRAEVVRTERTECGGAVSYDVMVWTNEDGATLLGYKDDVSLRDWLKACWGRGVNPRVMNPWLPHGIEERLGVDYYGNDVLKPIRQRARKD